MVVRLRRVASRAWSVLPVVALIAGAVLDGAKRW
jgi:hypothetical protein